MIKSKIRNLEKYEVTMMSKDDNVYICKVLAYDREDAKSQAHKNISKKGWGRFGYSVYDIAYKGQK